MKVPLRVVPFAPLLHAREIFSNPSSPEEISEVLCLPPSPPRVRVLLFEKSMWQDWLGFQLKEMVWGEGFQIVRIA